MFANVQLEIGLPTKRQPACRRSPRQRMQLRVCKHAIAPCIVPCTCFPPFHRYTPTWHCVVGRNFGSYVTHEQKHFIYFYLGQIAILLFKSG